MRFCYCTLAIGPKYNQLAKIFLRTFVDNIQNDIPVVVVTDHHDKLLDHPRVIQHKFNNALAGSYISFKWLAFRHALSTGYDNICFVDVDSVVSAEYNQQMILNNLRKDGLGCNWHLTYKQGFKPKSRGSQKLARLVENDETYPITCPVECFMFLHGDRSRSIRFINEWQRIQQQIHDRKLYHREVCHEIGLAAARVNLPVYRFIHGRQAYITNFKHYGNNRGKQQMIEDWKETDT